MPKAGRPRRAAHRRRLSPDAWAGASRCRSCSSSPASSPAWWSPAAMRTRRRFARRRAARPAPTPAATTRRRTAAGGRGAVAGRRGGPDFTRVAGQAVKGVANISSLQVVRTRNSPFANDPVLPLLLRRRRAVRLARSAIAQPRLGRHHLRATATSSPTTTSSARTSREITIALPDKREIKGKVIGTDPTTDIALLKIDVDRPAGRAVGRLGAAEGRRMGAGDRQPVPAQSDGHRRHRQRDRPRQHGLRATTRTSSRPTPRSIPATRAAR